MKYFALTKIVDVIETHSNICDMDAHVALNLTEDMYLAFITIILV